MMRLFLTFESLLVSVWISGSRLSFTQKFNTIFRYDFFLYDFKKQMVYCKNTQKHFSNTKEIPFGGMKLMFVTTREKKTYQNSCTFLVIVNRRQMQSGSAVLAAFLNIDYAPIVSHHFQCGHFVEFSRQMNWRLLLLVQNICTYTAIVRHERHNSVRKIRKNQLCAFNTYIESK